VIKKAEILLDESLTTLEKRQKHIKVADLSEFRWSTVKHYESHPLAADLDDEKHLEKAKKEAERAANKHRCGGDATGIKNDLVIIAFNVSTSEVGDKQCVDKHKASGEVNDTDNHKVSTSEVVDKQGVNRYKAPGEVNDIDMKICVWPR